MKEVLITAYANFISHMKKKLKSKKDHPLWIVAQDLGGTDGT